MIYPEEGVDVNSNNIREVSLPTSVLDSRQEISLSLIQTSEVVTSKGI
jgi:hypothetical protein